jgi:hypothetical protein
VLGGDRRGVLLLAGGLGPLAGLLLGQLRALGADQTPTPDTATPALPWIAPANGSSRGPALRIREVRATSRRMGARRRTSFPRRRRQH